MARRPPAREPSSVPTGPLRGTRMRVAVAVVALLAFSALLSVLAIRQVLLARTAHRVDAALTQEVQEFRTLVRAPDPLTGRPRGTRLDRAFDAHVRRNAPAQGQTLIAYVRGREYVVSSASTAALPAEARPRRWVTLRRSERGDLETPAGTVRYVAVPVRVAGEDRGVFVVASALAAEREEVGDTVRVVAIVLLCVLVIASVVAWAVAGRVVAPLRQLAATSRSIAETDVTRRIPVSGDDEVAELARAFNATLDRVEAASDARRAFAGDAGRELRTPIAVVRGHLQALGDDAGERRETIGLVTGELDRMDAFVDDLLLLAKAERADFLRVAEVELGALTDELLADAVALGPRDWRLEARGEGVLTADRRRVTQAITALARNAVEHTEAGDPVWLGSAIDDVEARLWVRDEGPGVAWEHQQRIFERFARTGSAPRRSAGLGLAIVRAIAEAHGGSVTVLSRPGAGATFTLRLPSDGHDWGRAR